MLREFDSAIFGLTSVGQKSKERHLHLRKLYFRILRRRSRLRRNLPRLLNRLMLGQPDQLKRWLLCCWVDRLYKRALLKGAEDLSTI
jgi:hypothetical protein